MRFDSCRVLSDQVVAEVVYRGLDSFGSELHACLSPAGDPFLGADAHERPLRWTDERIDGGDLHVGSLPGSMVSDAKRLEPSAAVGMRRRTTQPG